MQDKQTREIRSRHPGHGGGINSFQEALEIGCKRLVKIILANEFDNCTCLSGKVLFYIFEVRLVALFACSICNMIFWVIFFVSD